jgi:hypothetical protein
MHAGSLPAVLWHGPLDGRSGRVGYGRGIIAAQSIGEPGTQLTMRTFHIGGVASKDVETSELFAKRGGQVRFTRIRSVFNAEGGQVVLGRNGEISIVDDRGREVEKQRVPNGAVLQVKENQNVNAGDVLCTWDPHSIPIIAQVGGRARLDDCVEGQSIRTEKEAVGNDCVVRSSSTRPGCIRRSSSKTVPERFWTSTICLKGRVWTSKTADRFLRVWSSPRRLANQPVLRTSPVVCLA